MKFSQNFIGTEAVQPPEYSRTPTSFRLRSERNSPTRRSAQEGRHQGFHPLVNHPFPKIVWRRPETGDRCENGERQSGYSCVYFATYSQFTDNVLLHRRLNQRRRDIPVSRNSLSWWLRTAPTHFSVYIRFIWHSLNSPLFTLWKTPTSSLLTPNSYLAETLSSAQTKKSGLRPLFCPNGYQHASFSEQNLTSLPSRIIFVVRTAHILPHIEQV